MRQGSAISSVKGSGLRGAPLLPGAPVHATLRTLNRKSYSELIWGTAGSSWRAVRSPVLALTAIEDGIVE